MKFKSDNLRNLSLGESVGLVIEHETGIGNPAVYAPSAAEFPPVWSWDNLRPVADYLPLGEVS